MKGDPEDINEKKGTLKLSDFCLDTKSFPFPDISALAYERKNDLMDQIISDVRRKEDVIMRAQLLTAIRIYTPSCTEETLMDYLPKVEARYDGETIMYYYHPSETLEHYLFQTKFTNTLTETGFTTELTFIRTTQ